MLFAGGLWRSGFDLGASELLRGLYFLAGASAGLNPAYSQFNGFIETVPVALLQLRLQLDGYRYFGANGALLRFPSDESRFGRKELKDAAGSEASGMGYRLLVSPTLRVKVGSIIVRSQTDISHFRVDSANGTYFEWEYDTLIHERDWVITNRTAVLGILSQGRGDEILVAGPVYEWTRAIGTNVERHRLGGALFWVPSDKWGAFARPRLFTLAGINLSDRNRQWQPFGLVGVGIDWDAWTDPA